MTKQTVFITLTFVAGQPTATASISIPFPVKKIHVKSVAFDAGTVAVDYVCISSQFGLNAPLALCYRDNTYSAPTVNDIEIELKNPEIIQGNYTFTLLSMTGTPVNGTVNNDNVGMILEFNSE
jgi:hypothetical protein